MLDLMFEFLLFIPDYGYIRLGLYGINTVSKQE